MMNIYLQSVCLFGVTVLLSACSSASPPEDLLAPVAEDIVSVVPVMKEFSEVVPAPVETTLVLTRPVHNILPPRNEETVTEKPVETTVVRTSPSLPLVDFGPVVKSSQTESLTRTYIVKGGETLWTIAARPELYGDALLWSLLYQANRDQIKDPRQIYPEQVLSVPRGHTDEELQAAREWARKSEVFPLPKNSN